jgi:ribosome-binding factor A
MDSTRLARLQQLILEELSVRISREVKDPRVPSITITRVELTPDAGQATIYVTLLGESANETPEYKAKIKDCLEGLVSASGFLRRAISKVLTIRQMPTIVFKEDKGLTNTLRVNELLKQIAGEK